MLQIGRLITTISENNNFMVGIAIFEYRYYRDTEIVFSSFSNTELSKFNQSQFRY